MTEYWYKDALQYTLGIIRKSGKYFLDKEDILHDVICEEDFSIDSYKKRVVSRVKEAKEYRSESIHFKEDVILSSRYCPCCNAQYAKEYRKNNIDHTAKERYERFKLKKLLQP